MISYIIGVVVTFFVLRGINHNSEQSVELSQGFLMSLLSWLGLLIIGLVSVIILFEDSLKGSSFDKWFQGK